MIPTECTILFALNLWFYKIPLTTIYNYAEHFKWAILQDLQGRHFYTCMHVPQVQK